MKVRCLLIGMVVLFIAGILTTSSYAIDTANIIGQWHLDEGSGNVAKDSSNGKLDGTLTHNPQWVDGKFGKALQFNGDNTCVNIPFGGKLPDKYTLSVWVYQLNAAPSPRDDEATKEGYGQTIFSSSGAVGGVLGSYWCWLLVHKGEKIRLYSFATDPVLVNSLVTEPGTFSMKKWHNIVVVSTKGADTIIYIDGVEKLKAKNQGLDPPATAALFIGDLRVDRQIGFNGIIDEVLLLNVALSQAQVSQMLAVSPSGKLATTWATIKTQ